MKLQQVDLPSHWASALINNDRSGLTDAEELEMDAYLAQSGLDKVWFICLSDHPYLNPFLGRFQGLLSEMITYSYEER